MPHLLTHKSAKLTKIKYGPNQKKCSIFSVKECSWMGNQLFKYLVSLFQHILITIISWSSANRSLFQIFRLHGFQAHRESNFRTCRCLHHQGQILKKLFCRNTTDVKLQLYFYALFEFKLISICKFAQ